MTKTKIGVEIHQSGDKNDNLLKAVANHNAGLCSITRTDIEGFLNIHKAMFPTLRSSRYSCKRETHTLHISEDDGETFTITLTWKEVHELELPTFEEIQKEMKDDLTGIFPMDEVTAEVESELLKNKP